MVNPEASLTRGAVAAAARRHAGHPLAVKSSCFGKVGDWLEY